jgi:hypothetical protein
LNVVMHELYALIVAWSESVHLLIGKARSRAGRGKRRRERVCERGRARGFPRSLVILAADTAAHAESTSPRHAVHRLGFANSRSPATTEQAEQGTGDESDTAATSSMSCS